MTKTAFDRDNVLTPEDRIASARKCLEILADADLQGASKGFVGQQREKSQYTNYQVSERQLAWLRDLVDLHIG